MNDEQWTTECLPHGSGQCDGAHYGGRFDGQWCGCPCHNDPDLPSTVEAVKVWHDEYHGIPNRASDGYWQAFCTWLVESPMSEYSTSDSLDTLMALYDEQHGGAS